MPNEAKDGVRAHPVLAEGKQGKIVWMSADRQVCDIEFELETDYNYGVRSVRRVLTQRMRFVGGDGGTKTT